jgi:hypothetical protein
VNPKFAVRLAAFFQESPIMVTKRSQSPRLSVETLEARDTPSSVVVQIQNSVFVYGDSKGANVVVSRPTPQDNLKITDNQNGKVYAFAQKPTDMMKVVFIGKGGPDTFSAAGAWAPIIASGMGGNDFLTAGNLGSTLDGGAGNDWLVGGAGADNLYGRAGNDILIGGAGSDFLDAGSAGEYQDGGDGYDFLAYKPVLNGTTANDVNQTKTPSCWIDAPLAAAAKQGINLASRITYLGNGNYQVKLLDANNQAHFQKVSLEGGRFDFEPAPVGDESWVILYQRAIMQQLGNDWHQLSDYSTGTPGKVMSMLTGRANSSYGSFLSSGGLYDTTNDQEMIFIQKKLAAGKLVCAMTRQGDFDTFNVLGSVSTPMLSGAHVYSVESVDWFNMKVTLRNPWGSDIGDGTHATQVSGSNDGLVTISFTQFYDSMWNYYVS